MSVTSVSAELTGLVSGLDQWLRVHGADKLAKQMPLVQGRPYVEGSHLYYNEHKYDLSASATTLELCRIFCKQPFQRIKKPELVQALYGATEHFSEQLKRAIDHNVVKRLSRARLLLKGMTHDHAANHMWFYYDSHDAFWYLRRCRFY